MMRQPEPGPSELVWPARTLANCHARSRRGAKKELGLCAASGNIECNGLCSDLHSFPPGHRLYRAEVECGHKRAEFRNISNTV
jgi:hypothetical protein